VDARLLDVLQLARDEQHETALLRLREYLRAHPQDPDAWIVLGGLAPDQKIALSALRRAVQLAPENTMAREALTALEAQTIASMPEFPPVPELVPLGLPTHTVHEPPVSAPEPEVTTQAEDTESFESPRDVEGAEGPHISWELESQQAPDVISTPEEAVQPEMTGDADFQAARDARAVLWPFVARGEKPRPLGALLDENRLTRQDLLWAAQEARNEDVRQAAQVLLDTTHRLADVTMAPEDARLIAWPFRRLNRPLGKLVDAGTVGVKDLRRAAWYAKDARLREAARVMLPVALERREVEKRRRAAQKERPQTVEPTSAKSAPPSAEPQQNDLVASTGKTSKPERKPVRAPADSSKAERAASDAYMARPMPVIQGSDYLANEVQRRYRQNLFIAAVVMFLILAGLFVVLAIIVIEFVNRKEPALWLWPLVPVLLLPLFWLSNRFVELRQEEQNFRRGQLGESEVTRLLRLGLGGDWTLFRNVKLPGSKVDIDMVLLGPPGVFALEVKAYTGNYRYAKQHFYRRSMMSWRKMQHNPGKQARAAGGVLHAYITDTLNEDVWVEPRLVWVGPGALMLEEPEVFVWFVEKLDQETERLRALPRKLSAETRAALSGLLRGLCSTLR
jgi:hypothetical protein